MSMPPPFNPHIFRAYDIRGIVGQDLTAEVMYWLGRAIASQALSQGVDMINLGYDGRLSSPEFAQAMAKGLAASGCTVQLLGAVPTGLAYFSTYQSQASSVVMITGSHNPANYNGVKIVLAQQALSGAQIQALYQRLVSADLHTATPPAAIKHLALNTAYHDYIVQQAQFQRPLKVVLDAGNGIGGPTAQKIFTSLGLNAEFLYCEVDGHFPHHHPDPGVVENLAALRQRVLESQADVGVALDGDADRVAIIDNLGHIIWPDKLLMFLIADALPRHPRAKVIYDVKSSAKIPALAQSLGGEAIMTATGHSLMKAKMAEHQALYGGEFSGHLYIKENWFGFDDGIFAAVRILQVLSQQPLSSAEVFAAIKTEVSTPEITLTVGEQEKFAIIAELDKDSEFLAAAVVHRVDGLRLEYPDGWCLIRASNTTPKLTLRFAGDNQAVIERLQQQLNEYLSRFGLKL